MGCNQPIQNWIQQTARATIFAYNSSTAYPCVFDEYRDLVDHPRDEPGYREEATAGSILVPTLAVWAATGGDTDTLAVLADFASGAFQHSTLQLWYPGPDTEMHLYRGSSNHGLSRQPHYDRSHIQRPARAHQVRMPSVRRVFLAVGSQLRTLANARVGEPSPSFSGPAAPMAASVSPRAASPRPLRLAIPLIFECRKRRPCRVAAADGIAPESGQGAILFGSVPGEIASPMSASHAATRCSGRQHTKRSNSTNTHTLMP